MSECNLTLSTLHHQGQPGVDVVTRLLGLRGHRYAVEVTGLSIGLEIKRRIEGCICAPAVVDVWRWLKENIRMDFFLLWEIRRIEFIRSGYLSQQSVFGTNSVTYGNYR